MGVGPRAVLRPVRTRQADVAVSLPLDENRFFPRDIRGDARNAHPARRAAWLKGTNRPPYPIPLAAKVARQCRRHSSRTNSWCEEAGRRWESVAARGLSAVECP